MVINVGFGIGIEPSCVCLCTVNTASVTEMIIITRKPFHNVGTVQCYSNRQVVIVESSTIWIGIHLGLLKSDHYNIQMIVMDRQVLR